MIEIKAERHLEAVNVTLVRFRSRFPVLHLGGVEEPETELRSGGEEERVSDAERRTTRHRRGGKGPQTQSFVSV